MLLWLVMCFVFCLMVLSSVGDFAVVVDDVVVDVVVWLLMYLITLLIA